ADGRRSARRPSASTARADRHPIVGCGSRRPTPAPRRPCIGGQGGGGGKESAWRQDGAARRCDQPILAPVRTDRRGLDDARERPYLQAARMCSHPIPPMSRAGVTLVELCLVLAIVGILASVATRQITHYFDRTAARAAVAEAASVVLRARDEAM